MSARVRAPQTVVTRPTAMYGSMIAMAREHLRRLDALSSSAKRAGIRSSPGGRTPRRQPNFLT
jgi:hypothetical protein